MKRSCAGTPNFTSEHLTLSDTSLHERKEASNPWGHRKSYKNQQWKKKKKL